MAEWSFRYGAGWESDQSIGRFPAPVSASLILLNGRLPKNPLRADKGEGWADFRIMCRAGSIRDSFFWAYAPHNTNTTRSRFSLTLRMMASVNNSQPRPRWLLGSWARTVSTAFSNKTPC